MICEHDAAIKNSTPVKFKNKDLHNLFIETLFWINLCL